MKRVMNVIAAMLIAASVAGYATGAEVKKKVESLPKGHPAISAAKQETVAYSGKVLKTMNSGGYSYFYLQEENGRKLWLAVPETKAKIKVGGKASFAIGAEMKNFESKTLKRTFDSIIFSNRLITQNNSGKSTTALDNPGSKGTLVSAKKVKVAKATDPKAHTVAELFALKQALAGEKVVVRGNIVKVSPSIMKMNWLHIQDGTGIAAKKDHDLVVTTKALPSEGEVVTVSGILIRDKDFGSGYKYDIIIENAEVNH